MSKQITPYTSPASPALPTARAERIREFVQASESSSKQITYAKLWRGFVAYCTEHGYDSLPAAPGAVADFITARAKQGRKVNTIQVTLAAIADAHNKAKQPNPCATVEVKTVMQGIRRKLGAKPHQKAPLTLADMRKLISTLAGDDLRAVRDRALLLVGYAGAFRRSELVALTRADVRFKQGEMVITLQRSKTDQEGAGSTKTIPSAEDPTICPVVAMRAWLNAAEVNSGHVFRAIDRWGHVRNGQMQGKEVARIVKKACEAAGIDAGQFGGHSLRAGFITTAAEGGAQQWQIAEISGHKPGSKVLEQYIRTAGRGGVRAAKLAYGESGE